MCGENALAYTVVIIHIGSPPHVRGKLIALATLSDAVGITPACAGKTFQFPFLYYFI